jgi:NitT/TauT family transport system permease protein
MTTTHTIDSLPATDAIDAAPPPEGAGALNPDGEPARGDGASAAAPRPRGYRRRLSRILRAAKVALWRSAAIVVFLLAWELVPQFLLGEDTRVFLPPLHDVLRALLDAISSGELWDHLSASLTRSVTGFSIAVTAGIALGLALAWYRKLASFLTPLLELFRNTAALALLPVFVLLLGIGETSKIAIVAYASFFPVLLNTIAGATTVDPLLIRAARSLGLSQVRLFQKVILPSAVPTIFTGIRMGGTASILVLIAAEMVGAKAGLGFQIVNAQSSFLIPQMYAGILTVSLLGLAVNVGLVRLEAHFSKWRTFAPSR